MLSPAQLTNASLRSVQFDENPSFPRTEIGRVVYQVKSTVSIDDFHRWEEQDETHAIVGLSASVEWSADDDEPLAETPFTLDIVVRGLFEWDSMTIDEALARSWLEYNATHLLWPYLRAYISAVTAFSSLPTLTIYTVSVPESPDFGSEENALQQPGELAQSQD